MLNKVILMGRLTRDPEIRITSVKNVKVASFTVAINRNYVSEGQERQTDFISVQAFSRTAEFIERYFKKGSPIVITGRLQSRSWDDAATGAKRYAMDVIAEEVSFSEGSKGNNDGTNMGNTAQEPANIDNSAEGFAVVSDIPDDELPF